MVWTQMTSLDIADMVAGRHGRYGAIASGCGSIHARMCLAMCLFAFASLHATLSMHAASKSCKTLSMHAHSLAAH